MLPILFSKYSIIFFIAVINLEYLIKYSANIADEKRRSTILKFADAGNVAAFCFMIYYSYLTVWWAFAGLLVVYVVLFVTINFLITQLGNTFSVYKKSLKHAKTSSDIFFMSKHLK